METCGVADDPLEPPEQPASKKRPLTIETPTTRQKSFQLILG